MSKKTGSNNIYINTDKVRGVAQQINLINQKTENNFDMVNKAMDTLQNNWSGAGATCMFSRFNEIKAKYAGASGRFAVIQQHTNFLNRLVADDYDETEKTNVSLADMFK